MPRGVGVGRLMRMMSAGRMHVWAAAAVLGMGLSGCMMPGQPKDDWASVVVDLKPVDSTPRADQPATLERPWLAFGLASDDDAGSPAAGPTTKRV